MIYVGFITLYYSEILQMFGWEINSWAGLIGLSVFFGLLITSICFALENLIFSILKKWRNFKRPEIIMLGIFEVRNKRTFYLNQLVGQYICHFNVGMGVLILTLIYIACFYSSSIVSVLDWRKTAFGLVISFVNLYLALGVFRNWSANAIERYEEECQQENPNPL